MPGITYTIRFIHRNPRGGIPCEEQEHLSLAEAWNAFRALRRAGQRRPLLRNRADQERNWEEGANAASPG